MRILRLGFLCWLTIGILSGGISASAQETEITIGKTLTIPSRIFRGPVPLKISLPAGYDQGSERYPVVIGFQIVDRFPAVAGIAAGLASAGAAPPLIVVSVGLNGDLFSLYAEERKPGSGRGPERPRFRPPRACAVSRGPLPNRPAPHPARPFGQRPVGPPGRDPSARPLPDRPGGGTHVRGGGVCPRRRAPG